MNECCAQYQQQAHAVSFLPQHLWIHRLAPYTPPRRTVERVANAASPTTELPSSRPRLSLSYQSVHGIPINQITSSISEQSPFLSYSLTCYLQRCRVCWDRQTRPARLAFAWPACTPPLSLLVPVSDVSPEGRCRHSPRNRKHTFISTRSPNSFLPLRTSNSIVQMASHL